jgi:hypothetical protein
MPSETQQDSLDAAERAVLYSDPMSNFEERPRLAGQPGLDSGLNGDNFGFINGNRSFANSHDMNNPWDRKNWQPVQRVKLAKDVPGEKWKLDFLKPVRPPVPALVQGQKRFVASSLQVSGNRIFVPTLNAQRVPRIIYVSSFHTRLQMALNSPMRVLSNLR